MNKCGLCQQICNNLTKIYNNRIKTLAQIILKLKGFKESSEFNALSICENCRHGIENVANFWEHLPEAKQENFSNDDSSIQEIFETSSVTSSSFQDEVATSNTTHLPVINSKSKCFKQYEQSKTPIKLKIKRIKEKNDIYTLVSSNSTEECSTKRLRRPPKRYNDFNVDLSTKTTKVIVNDKVKENRNALNKSSLHTLSPMATIRSINGLNLGFLTEVERNGQTSRMRLVCEICSNIYAYEKEFQMHMEVHKRNETIEAAGTLPHNAYLFYCKLCEKSFKEHYAVRRHYKIAHSEERPFKCEHCGANFKYKFNFDYHMAKHIPKKRFECSFCKKAFVMRYELKIHLRTHTKERPYKCEFCTYAFAHRSNLKAHQKLKHLKNVSDLNTPQDTITIEENKRNCLESYSDSEKNGTENTENISQFDESNLNSMSLEYKSEELLMDDSKNRENGSTFLMENSITSSSQMPKCNTEELKNFSDVMQAEEENRIVVRSSKNMADNLIYDYRKQFTSCASLYTIKMPITALRIIPQSSLLTIKKWPKSYQRAITENPKPTNVENTSTILEHEKLNQTSENSIVHTNKVEASESFSEKYELSNGSNSNNIQIDSKNSTISNCKNMSSNETSQTEEGIDSQTQTKPIFNINTCSNSYCDNNSSECLNKTEQGKDRYPVDTNISSNLDLIFPNKPQFKKDLSSFPFSNINNVENIDTKSSPVLNSNIIPTKSDEMCSYPKDGQKAENKEKTIHVSKFSKFSPPNFLGDIKIIKVSNKNKKHSSSNNNNESSKPHTISYTKTKAKSQTGNEIKVSTKPVKLLKLNNPKASNSMLTTSNKINLPKHSITTETSVLKLANKLSVFKETASRIAEVPKNTSAQSLLKPVIRVHQKEHNLNSNITPKTSNLIENLPYKPLITKVEILPSLNISQSLISFKAAPMHVQPPKEYKHQCAHCWKYFKQKSALTKHLRTHTGEKPYKCNLCPKSYADASNYKKHKILHKNAAEALNISFTSATVQPMQNSPAHSTVSDPDPDGIEIMQTIKKFDDNNGMYDDDDDDDNNSLSSSTMESYMWQDALDHALSNDEIRENIKRNLANFNNAIMPSNTAEKQQLTKNNFRSTNINRSLSCEDPD